MENEGFRHPATDAKGATTAQPERDLQTGDPSFVGAAPKEEKKGITGRVKDLVGRHGRRKNAQRSAGKTGKIREKVVHEVGYGEDGQKHGPTRLLSMSSSSSSMSSSDEEDIGTVGFALDPTGPVVAGRNLGRRDFTSAPAGPGADFSNLNMKPNANAATERHAKRAAEFAKWSNPLNPNETEGSDARGEHRHSPPSNSNESGDARGGEHHHPPPSNSNESRREDASYCGVDRSHPTAAGNSDLNSSEDALGGTHPETDDSNLTATDDGEPHSSTPAGMMKSEGGAVLGDHHEGPRDGNVKQEGFLSKIMDTFRSPKGEPSATTKD